MILDLGCKTGSNYKATDRISVDIRRNVLKKASGFRVQADITRPIVKPKSVDTVVLVHVLEHLNSLVEVETVLNLAVEAAREKVYIRGPWFDADEYLTSKGFTFFWSTWEGHKTHLTKPQLIDIVKRLPVKQYTVTGMGQLILDSFNHRIHPLGYEAGGNYTRGNYPPKEFCKFDIDIYDELYGEILC